MSVILSAIPRFASLFGFRFTSRLAPLAIVAAAALPSLPAAAGQAIRVCAAGHPCGRVQPIDEAQLDQVAGRFTVAGEVAGMSLQMTSAWQAANGQRLEGRATLSIAMSDSRRPQARLDTQALATDPRGAANTANPGAMVSGGAGLQRVDGVSQTIQIAGDGNDAGNRALVSIGSAAPAGAPANGAPNALATAANGAQASARIDGNTMQLQLHIPGAGIVQQQLNAAGNLQQAIQFAGSQQQAINQLQLQLQMQAPTRNAIASAGFGRALDMLRGK